MNAPKHRRQSLKKYGLTPHDWVALYESQSGCCWVCGDQDAERLAIDHSHTAPHVVRGLLCRRCNMGLGLFSDDPVLLQRAVLYLREQPAVKVVGVKEAKS